MNIRLLLPALALTLCAAASAEPADELLSAQAAFRQALSEQNTVDANLSGLQQKLVSAQQRKASAEADIQAYTQQLGEAQQRKAANDAALQQAGERLNAAWQAVHGSR